MIELRPEEAKEESFIQTVYGATGEEELKLTKWPEQQKRAFVKMQSMARLPEYKHNIPVLCTR
jgi:hypothetical protein